MPKQMTDEQRERLAISLITDGLAEGLTAKKRKADRATVRELVSNDIDGSEVRKTGFHDLCQQATAGLRDRELASARYQLRRDPAIVFDQAAEWEFRKQFPNTPDELLTAEIELVRRNRPLGR